MIWQLHPDEFQWVWEDIVNDDIVAPLQLSSNFRDEDGARQARLAAQAGYPHQGDPDLIVALRLLTAPATRATVIGDSPDIHPDGSAKLRMVAGGLGPTGVLAVQQPGAGPDHGGTVWVWLGSRPELPDRIIASIPPVPPGRRPALTAYTETVLNGEDDLQFSYSALTGPKRDDASQIRKLLHTPLAGHGAIRIEIGLKWERPAHPQFVSWIDLPGDGRYLLARNHDISVTPADPKTLTTELRRIMG